MNRDLLLNHFDRISEAPDAIPRLRRFILDLAVRGKLVEQDSNEEPASELFERIQAEKARLAKEGKIRKQIAQPDIDPASSPFLLPKSWIWARLGDVIQLLSGQHLQPGEYSEQKDGGLPYITGPADFGKNGLVITRHALVKKAIAKKGQILLTVKGAGVGKTAICNLPEVAISRQLMAMTAIEWSQQFLLLTTHRLAAALIESARSLIPGISREDVDQFIFPLPPLAEQHRIVTKVDELMALCGQLEAVRAERDGRRDRLAVATHHYLSNGTNAEAFRTYAHFCLKHLPRITTCVVHFKQLRQTILTLAVRGQLVPQDSADEPASALLKRIQAEKARLTKEGLLRKEKPLPPIDGDKIPFVVPTSWTWAKIGTCSLLTEYGTSVRSDAHEDGVPVLAMGNIQDGQVILSERKKVPFRIDDLPQLFLKRFDLLYNRTNSAELVGKTGIFLGDDDTYTFASYLIRIRFLNNLTSPLYANLTMNAPYYRVTQILPELQQQCGQANVNGTKLRNMLIPLPPLAEQHRIVSKVDELMAVCDQLETQLIEADAKSSGLLEAVLHHALNDTFEGASRKDLPTPEIDLLLARIPAHQ
jgi:type I restriction enzyme, S subunit